MIQEVSHDVDQAQHLKPHLIDYQEKKEINIFGAMHY